jgi:hypothetical protein
MPNLRADSTPMFEFIVEEMVSGRVAGAVSRAVRALDRGAVIRADPATQRLDVAPGASDAEEIVETLRAAGYTATLSARAADSTFAWVDASSSTGVDFHVAARAKALTDFDLAPPAHFGGEGGAGVAGSHPSSPARPQDRREP